MSHYRCVEVSECAGPHPPGNTRWRVRMRAMPLPGGLPCDGPRDAVLEVYTARRAIPAFIVGRVYEEERDGWRPTARA